MDSISLIRTPIEAELEAFKKLFDSSLSSSNALLDSVVSHIRPVSYTHLDVYKRQMLMLTSMAFSLFKRPDSIATPCSVKA